MDDAGQLTEKSPVVAKPMIVWKIKGADTCCIHYFSTEKRNGDGDANHMVSNSLSAALPRKAGVTPETIM